MKAIEKLDNSKVGTAWSISVDRPIVLTCTYKKYIIIGTMPVPGLVDLLFFETLNQYASHNFVMEARWGKCLLTRQHPDAILHPLLLLGGNYNE